MKPKNPISSWQPRRPSATLRKRLFNSDRAAILELPPWSLRWVAPAAACLLLILALQPQASRFSEDAGRPLSLVMVASNRLADVAAMERQEWNRVDSRSFEWTNVSGSTSSVGSFRETN
jgi:hypothetical protein